VDVDWLDESPGDLLEDSDGDGFAASRDDKDPAAAPTSAASRRPGPPGMPSQYPIGRSSCTHARR